MHRLKINILWQQNYLFDSFWVSKLLNKFISQGKKEYIELQFFLGLKLLKNLSLNPIFLIIRILQKSKSSVGLRLIRKKTRKKRVREYVQVPFPLTRARQLKISFGLFETQLLNNISLISLSQKLYLEVFNFYVLKNLSLLSHKKKVYRTAFKNRVLIHYRWN